MPLGYETKIQIRGNSLLIYDEPQYLYDRTYAQKSLLAKNLHKNKTDPDAFSTYSGKLTVHARKRLTKAISLLVQISRQRKIFNPISNRYENHRLSFLTLTIPSQAEIVTLKQGHNNLLKPFLMWLRDTGKIKTYIWKAEVQKRGQLHYHITTNSWIHYQIIRNKWNYILSKNDLMKEYIEATGNANPNSTDIHSVYRINDIQSYLTKEFAKSIQNDHSSHGKLWNCSTNLKGKKYFSVYLKEEHNKNIFLLDRRSPLRETTTEFCTILKTKDNLSYTILTKEEKAQYKDYITSIRRDTNDIFSSS